MLSDGFKRRLDAMLARWPLPPRFAAIVCGAVTSSVLLFAASDWGESVNQYVARKTEFNTRELLDNSPAVNRRIKIFAFDDPTVAYYQANDLSLEDWVKVLATISRSKPNRIMIDKLFDIPRSGEGLDTFEESMAKIATPVIVASFAHSNLIPTRHQLLDPAHSPAGAATIKRSFRKSPSPIEKHVGLFARKSMDSFIYGPHPKLLGGFDKVGHIVYWRDGYLHAYLATNGEEVLPHWSTASCRKTGCGTSPASRG